MRFVRFGSVSIALMARMSQARCAILSSLHRMMAAVFAGMAVRGDENEREAAKEVARAFMVKED